MRLWLVSHNYHPEPTGIPYYNTALAEWFVRRGWQVEVLTGMPHYPWWKVPDAYAHRDYDGGNGDEVINGVIVHRVRHFVPTPPVSGASRIRLDVSYLGNWMQRSLTLHGRPDIIIGVAPPFLIGGLLLWLRHHVSAPVVYHVQDLQIDAALELDILPRWLGGALRAAERWQLKKMDLVTACGRGMLARLHTKARLRRPSRHWPNWTDCTTFSPWMGHNPEREQLDGGDPEAVVGLYSGNLGQKQGLDVLVEATRILQGHPRWRTVIAGSGVERIPLAQQAYGIPNLMLQDLRSLDSLPAFLAAADIHIIPQRAVAADLVLPSKLLNILAVGRPVVVTANPHCELFTTINEAGCGIVVPPEEPQALADALALLASDPQLRQTMGLAGRLWVEQHYGADHVLEAVERDLLNLIQTRQKQDR